MRGFALSQALGWTCNAVGYAFLTFGDPVFAMLPFGMAIGLFLAPIISGRP